MQVGIDPNQARSPPSARNFGAPAGGYTSASASSKKTCAPFWGDAAIAHTPIAELAHRHKEDMLDLGADLAVPEVAACCRFVNSRPGLPSPSPPI